MQFSNVTDLHKALESLGTILQNGGMTYEIVIVGGSALLLTGFVNRPTMDVDVIALAKDGRFVRADPLPPELADARDTVADAMRLNRNWLNPGPALLYDTGSLPPGFEKRLSTFHFGGLVVHTMGRLDLIYLKFFALVDADPKSRHLGDLQSLRPSPDELKQAYAWVRMHDPSPGLHELAWQVLKYLGVEPDDE